jgi:outer membrane protein
MKITLFIITGFALLTISVKAQQNQVQSMSLQQVIEIAKKNNYTILNSKLDQQMAGKKADEILASGLPQINATGSFNNYLDIPVMLAPLSFFNPKAPEGSYTAIKFGVPYTATGSITASQLIFDGTFFLGLKAAREYVNLARLGVKRTETEITAAVTKMYYAALLTEANINMLNNTLATLEKTLKDNRAYYQNGLSEKIDLNRLELSYSNTQIQRDKIIDQYTISIMVLKMQLGLSVKDSIVLTDNLEKLFTSEASSVVETKIDYKKRDDYKFVEQEILLQDYDIKRYKFGYAPTLNATYTTQRVAYGPQLSQLGTDFGNMGQVWFPTTIFALNLNLPIFDGFRKSAQIQQSKLTMMKFQNDKKNLESSIENDVEQSRLKYVRAKEQMDIQKKNMALAQDIYDRANIKYKNGVGSTLELTTAENELKTSQTNYLGSIYDMLVAKVDLKKALGILN